MYVYMYMYVYILGLTVNLILFNTLVFAEILQSITLHTYG